MEGRLTHPGEWDDDGVIDHGWTCTVDVRNSDQVSRVTLVTLWTYLKSPGSLKRTVTMTVSGTVWTTGPRILGRVGSPDDDSDNRRLVR